MFLPNAYSFLLMRPVIKKEVILSGIQEPATNLPPSSSSDSGRKMFLQNKHSFLLAKSVISKPVIQYSIQESARSEPARLAEASGVARVESATNLPPPSSPSDSSKPTIGDKNKRTFLKMAGIAGASIIGSLLLPKKADALIMGSSPTTGVVGVKNSTNARINPATIEAVSTLSELTFDTGSLNVKVTSQPATGNSFSNVGNEAKSGLVDGDRHVQVDVVSSALPTDASTETALQTIAFGGVQFALRMATVGDFDYVGEATVGTADSGTTWRIKRIDNSSGIVIKWASGTAGLDKIWDNGVTNYASYNYS